MTLEYLGEILTSIWTVLAIVVFAGIAFWAFRPRNRQRFEKDGRIPFNDER